MVMQKGERAGDAPIGVDVIEGKSYYWCSCGKSSKQPFCDGSHKGSKFEPMTFNGNLWILYGQTALYTCTSILTI